MTGKHPFELREEVAVKLANVIHLHKKISVKP